MLEENHARLSQLHSLNVFSGTSSSPENDDVKPSFHHVSISAHKAPHTNDLTPVEATTSLPGSRVQSPLSGPGLCQRINESSGSVSLPTTPLSSRTRSPDFLLGKTSQKMSRDGSGTASSATGGNFVGKTTRTENVSLRQNKSATVDLGMLQNELRKTASSPEIDDPVKEKRGKQVVCSVRHIMLILFYARVLMI